MKVLWVMNKELDAASDRAYIAELAKALEDHKIYTKIIARYRKRKEVYPADIEYLNTMSLKGLKQLSYLIKLPAAIIRTIKNIAPDIIVADKIFLTYPFIFVILWARRNKKECKFILDVRSLPNDITSMMGKINLAFIKYGLKLAGKYFDGCMVITQPMKQYVQKYSQFADERIGMWTSAFAGEIFNPEAVSYKEEIKNNNKFNIIYHGAIASNRNLVELISAMKFTPDNFHLILLGNGPILPKLKEMVCNLSIQAKVSFYEPVLYDQVPAYLKSADIGIVPIPDTLWFHVSMPIKFLEYMAMALPIVVPQIEPIKYVIGNAQADIVSYQLSSKNLSQEISKALCLAYEKWGKNYVSLKNRNLVISRFTWEVQASEINNFFKKILILHN